MSGPSAWNRSSTAPEATAVSIFGNSCWNGVNSRLMVTLSYFGSLLCQASITLLKAIVSSWTQHITKLIVTGSPLAAGAAVASAAGASVGAGAAVASGAAVAAAAAGAAVGAAAGASVGAGAAVGAAAGVAPPQAVRMSAAVSTTNDVDRFFMETSLSIWSASSWDLPRGLETSVRIKL